MSRGAHGRLWEALGSPSSIDPDSGTTPAEYLASVREDVGGATLRRLTTAMASPARRRLGGGSVVYGGDVPSRVIARETGFKEGQAIRVLPSGHVRTMRPPMRTLYCAPPSR